MKVLSCSILQISLVKEPLACRGLCSQTLFGDITYLSLTHCLSLSTYFSVPLYMREFHMYTCICKKRAQNLFPTVVWKELGLELFVLDNY